MNMTEEYNIELQRLYLEFLVSDHDLFVRCNSILNENYFDRGVRESVKFLREYVNDYNKVPEISLIQAKTGIELQDIGQTGIEHRKWFLDDFEKFCRHKALESAILASADKLERKEYGAVEELIRSAVQIGLAKELGTDYWKDPTTRLRRILERKGGTSTGWSSVDFLLYGGFNRGELNIFAGGSGAGKSLFLQNLAVNWIEKGYNVLYVSLELSEDLCSMRLDSMVTGFKSKEILKNIDDVALKVAMKGKRSGRLQVVQLPNGINVNDLRAYVKEYQIQHNVKVDAVLVDYLDLMLPAKVKISADNVFLKDKHVSEELRNFAMEGDYLFATASQLNRSAVDEADFDHSHIAGGLSKIQTADNVIGIFSSMAMRERGRVQIQFMKTRSSNGVGQKIDLELNVDTLRISDLSEDQEGAEEAVTSSLYEKISRNKSAGPIDKAGATGSTISSVTGGDKLRALIRRSE
jgi:KaiC/GvpD/RAD55 family RecA-like ATPase